MDGERAPRIPPGGARELGRFAWGVLNLVRLRTGGPIPNVMRTLGRHRGLFLPWLLFASRLMPYGKLPPAVSELVILRVGMRCGSDYEIAHHRVLGAQAGLSAELIAWVLAGEVDGAPAHGGVAPEQAQLVARIADTLVTRHDLGDADVDALRAHFDDEQILELSMLAGHYAMLATTLNVARTPIEPGAGMAKLR